MGGVMQLARLYAYILRFITVLFWVAVLVLFFGFSRIVNLFKTEKSINIFTWPLLLDVAYLENFERETGIKINVSYFESNDELFSKLRATKGMGYDLVIPSDYMVEVIINEGLLQKIDHNKIDAWHDIDPKLLGLYFDPRNEYTIPYFWAVYGLGIDKAYFNGQVPEPSWDLVFDKAKMPPSVGMFDAAREVVLLASQYLFGSSDIAMTPRHIMQVKKLLLDQKAWVGAYTESSIEHLLLGKICPVVVAMGPDILRIKRKNPDIDFIIPKEGSFALIDSFAIPSKSTKKELVYKFINYLYRPDVVKHHQERFGLCSPIKNLQEPEVQQFCPNDRAFAKMKFFKTTIPETLLNEIWIELMAH
jgi:spermidine/putrescine transport system substrate-binding protein